VERERGASAKGREHPGQVGSTVRPVRSVGGSTIQGSGPGGGDALATLVCMLQDSNHALIVP
jgi:hypothetical protein